MMRRRTCVALLATIFTGLGRVPVVLASEPCCARCRRLGRQQKICRLVCEEKKVQVVCWGCKYEDFCLPGPSRPGDKHCEEACGPECDGSGVCHKPTRFVWREWIPGCATGIRTKKKLMKKIETKTIPSYRWVVEELCPDCERDCECAQIEPGADVPAPPVADAKLVYRLAPMPIPPKQ